MRINFVKITDNLFNKTGYNMKIKIVVLFIGFFFQFIGAEVFEGYTLFTPSEGGQSNGATTYLKNNEL